MQWKQSQNKLQLACKYLLGPQLGVVIRHRQNFRQRKMEKAEAKYAQELKKFIPTMEKMFQRLEADLKEEGYDWSSHKKTKIAHIKQTYKKDYGPETACFKASAQLPFDPEFILDNIVLNTESIKVSDKKFN